MEKAWQFWQRHGLSIRTANALANADVSTVEQLQEMSERELLSIPGFGRHCLSEVKGRFVSLRNEKDQLQVAIDRLATALERVADILEPIARRFK